MEFGCVSFETVFRMVCCAAFQSWHTHTYSVQQRVILTETMTRQSSTTEPIVWWCLWDIFVYFYMHSLPHVSIRKVYVQLKTYRFQQTIVRHVILYKPVGSSGDRFIELYVNLLISFDLNNRHYNTPPFLGHYLINKLTDTSHASQVLSVGPIAFPFFVRVELCIVTKPSGPRSGPVLPLVFSCLSTLKSTLSNLPITPIMHCFSQYISISILDHTNLLHIPSCVSSACINKSIPPNCPNAQTSHHAPSAWSFPPSTTVLNNPGILCCSTNWPYL